MGHRERSERSGRERGPHQATAAGHSGYYLANVRQRRPLVFALVVLFVLFRSAMFVFKPGLDFDSDQAVFGLMGKHLMEGRAFPLLHLRPHYLLAVEAWLAAPMFFLFPGSRGHAEDADIARHRARPAAGSFSSASSSSPR